MGGLPSAGEHRDRLRDQVTADVASPRGLALRPVRDLIWSLRSLHRSPVAPSCSDRMSMVTHLMKRAEIEELASSIMVLLADPDAGLTELERRRWEGALVALETVCGSADHNQSESIRHAAMAGELQCESCRLQSDTD